MSSKHISFVNLFYLVDSFFPVICSVVHVFPYPCLLDVCHNYPDVLCSKRVNSSV